MSRHFQIKCTKIEGSKVTLTVQKLRDDIEDISADGGLEQYCFGFMIELNEYIAAEKVYPEVNNDAHPLKDQLQQWYWMKMGRKVKEAEDYPEVSHYEGEKSSQHFQVRRANAFVASAAVPGIFRRSAKAFQGVVIYSGRHKHYRI